MNIDIATYRASIGSFYFNKNVQIKVGTKYKIPSNISRGSTYKSNTYKYTTNFSTTAAYKFLIVCLFILLSGGGLCPSSSSVHSFHENISRGPYQSKIYLYQTKKENINQYIYNTFIYSRSEQFKSDIKYSYSSISNFQARYKYGNKKKQGLRLCHWNKSNSSLLKKMPEIRNIVSQYRPHLLGISEANCHKNQDTSLFSIKDYKTFLGLPSNNGMIRILLYVHKDISVNVCPDLMSPDLSSIWVEAGFKHNKKILINNFYRK